MKLCMCLFDYSLNHIHIISQFICLLFNYEPLVELNMELVTDHYAHYVQLLTCILCYISVLISIDLFIIVHHCMLEYLSNLYHR